MGFLGLRTARSLGLASCFSLLILPALPAAAKPNVLEVEVGPIWNQMDAQGKCQDAARKVGGS